MSSPSRWRIAGAIAVFLVIACGSPSEPDRDDGGAPPPASSRPATVDDGSVGDGVHQVGVGITPGQWETTVPATSLNCYWARKAGLSGNITADIIDNGNLAGGAKGIVIVQATDKYVEFMGGCRWRRV